MEKAGHPGGLGGSFIPLNLNALAHTSIFLQWNQRPGATDQDAASCSAKSRSSITDWLFLSTRHPHPRGLKLTYTHKHETKRVVFFVLGGAEREVWKGVAGGSWVTRSDNIMKYPQWMSVCVLAGGGGYVLPEGITDKKVADYKDARFLGSVRRLPFIKREEDVHGGVSFERLPSCRF